MLSGGGGKPAAVFVIAVLVVWALAAAQSKPQATPNQPPRM